MPIKLEEEIVDIGAQRRVKTEAVNYVWAFQTQQISDACNTLPWTPKQEATYACKGSIYLSADHSGYTSRDQPV